MTSRWLRLLLPVGSAGLIAVMPAAWRAALRYERAAILEEGEWWRLATAHLVHLNPSHLILDAVSLAVIALLFAPALSAVQWWLALLAGALTIDAALLVLEPQITWYVGLSGVIHAAFASGALATWCSRRLEGTIMLVLLVAKLAWEVLAGPMPWSEAASRGPVVQEVHLYGAVGGALAWALGRAARSSPSS